MGAHPGPGLCFWVPSSTNLLLRCSPDPPPLGSKAQRHKASFVCMYMYVYGYMCVAAGRQHQVSFSTLCSQIGSLSDSEMGRPMSPGILLSLFAPQC